MELPNQAIELHAKHVTCNYVNIALKIGICQFAFPFDIIKCSLRYPLHYLRDIQRLYT